MELGNLLFGNSRGENPVPREDSWENCFSTLLKLIDGPNYNGYGTEFVCEAFEIHRYYCGDCTCGFEEAEIAWETDNPHTTFCRNNTDKLCICGVNDHYAT